MDVLLIIGDKHNTIILETKTQMELIMKNKILFIYRKFIFNYLKVISNNNSFKNINIYIK
jgi:hypothetical protein